MKKIKLITIIFFILIIPKITIKAMNKNIFPINLAGNLDAQNQQENEDIPNKSIISILNDYEIEDQEALLAEEEERLENSNSNLEEEIEKDINNYENIQNENIVEIPNEYENFNNNIEKEELIDSNSHQLKNEDEIKNDEKTTSHYEENLKFLIESIEKLIED